MYWAAESWENVTTGAIRKSWKKLWKSLDFEENPTENDPVNLLPMIQNIPGCENAVEEDVDEWMAADGTSAETLTDDDIIAAVTQDHVQGDEGEGSDDEPGGGGGEEKVTHNEAAAALDLALRYLEQQSTATPADVMFMRKWRNYAAKNRLTKLQQMTMRDFMSNNK